MKVKNIKKSTDVSFKEIKSWYDEHLAPAKIDFEDQKPYEVYSEGKWAGIFQCTSNGAQQLFEKAKPKSIVDIATLTSIFRPGPLAAKVDSLYIEAKQGKEIDWGDKRINEILKDTFSCIIFQEQVMELAEKVAGFPKDKCDEVRRAIMKRSISGGEAAVKAAKEIRDSFVQGAIKNGYSEHVSNNLYDKILYFAGYGFNRSLIQKEEIKTYYKDGKLKEIKQIQHIVPGDIVRSRDEKTNKDILVKVTDKFDHGKLELVEVELKTGQKIRCTFDHKFRTVETKEMLPLWMIQMYNLSIVVNDADIPQNMKNHTINTF